MLSHRLMYLRFPPKKKKTVLLAMPRTPAWYSLFSSHALKFPNAMSYA